MTEVSKEFTDNFFKTMRENSTAKEDGTCRVDGCGGRVIKEATGFFRGRILYGTPSCEKCRKSYVFEKNASPRGGQEFLDSLNRPITI